MEQRQDSIDWGAVLRSRAGRGDPFAVYARMRELAPVCWSETARCWFVTRHEDVSALLTSPCLGARSKTAEVAALDPRIRPSFETVEAFLESWVLFSNPPAHTARRRAVQPEFTRRAIEPWGDGLRELASSVRDEALHGTADLVTDFARPYAARGICAMLGIERGDQPVALACSDRIMGYLTSGGWEEESAAEALKGITELRELLDDFVLPAGSSPIVRLLREHCAAGRLGGLDVAGIFAQLLTGGIEPVVSGLVTAALFGVLDRPRDADGSPGGPGDVPDLVSEALRFRAPFHFASRVALGEVPVAGVTIRPGDCVKLVIASANRDERVFAGADAFLRGRHRNARSDLSFGRGTHACLGASYARLQIEAGVTALRELGGRLRLTGEPKLSPSSGSTRYESVPVAIDPRPRHETAAPGTPDRAAWGIAPAAESSAMPVPLS